MASWRSPHGLSSGKPAPWVRRLRMRRGAVSPEIFKEGGDLGKGGFEFGAAAGVSEAGSWGMRGGGGKEEGEEQGDGESAHAGNCIGRSGSRGQAAWRVQPAHFRLLPGHY